MTCSTACTDKELQMEIVIPGDDFKIDLTLWNDSLYINTETDIFIGHSSANVD